MRLAVLSLLFIAATLAGETAASAQSAGSYPWCAIYYRMDAGGTPSCYFDTRQQCMETISGIGGLCVENQYYMGEPCRRHAARTPQGRINARAPIRSAIAG
jgi:Protein of unknown function (DUF3551)